MSAVLSSLPTTRVYPPAQPTRDGRSIAVEDCPELEHVGCRFRAYFDGHPFGIEGLGVCETAAIDDLWAMVEDHDEQLREKRDAERARYGYGSGE